jgi:2-iminobutanoate/2-iminopropanoate deaminase
MTRRAVAPDGVAPPQAYYSHGIVAPDGVIFVAGQVALDEQGQLVQGDAEAQARQVMENMARVLAAAGATLDDVVKTTTFLVDLDDRTAVGAARQERFAAPPPANSLLVVRSLAHPSFRVEIEAVAVRP